VRRKWGKKVTNPGCILLNGRNKKWGGRKKRSQLDVEEGKKRRKNLYKRGGTTIKNDEI